MCERLPMSVDEFEKLFEKQIELEKQILVNRARIYSGNGDRLWNFKEIGKVLNVSPEQVCLTLLMKQFIALKDYVQNGNYNKPEMEDEWITDIRNYLVLLKALFENERASAKCRESIDVKENVTNSIKRITGCECGSFSFVLSYEDEKLVVRCKKCGEKFDERFNLDVPDYSELYTLDVNDDIGG